MGENCINILGSKDDRNEGCDMSKSEKFKQVDQALDELYEARYRSSVEQVGVGKPILIKPSDGSEKSDKADEGEVATSEGENAAVETEKPSA